MISRRLLAFGCALFFALVSPVFGDEWSFELNITGITPQIEQQLLYGDRIIKDPDTYNMVIRVKNLGEKGWRKFQSLTVPYTYDAKTGRYTLSVTQQVSVDGQWIKHRQPIHIRVFAKTKYGNYIWTDVIRSYEALSDPIILNHYSGIEGDITSSPLSRSDRARKKEAEKQLDLSQPTEALRIPVRASRYRLIFLSDKEKSEHKVKLTIDGVARDIEKILIPGDRIRTQRGLHNISVRLKNESDTSWGKFQPLRYVVTFNPQNNHYTMRLRPTIQFSTKRIRIDEPIVIRVAAHTEYGNYIWTDVVRDLDTLGDPIILDTYSGQLGIPQSELKEIPD